jgi:diadenosine tetraphosphate (Ap4A) HIT family hydrolase
MIFQVIAFYGLHPVAPIAFLVVPKKPIPSLVEATPEDEPVREMISLNAKIMCGLGILYI